MERTPGERRPVTGRERKRGRAARVKRRMPRRPAAEGTGCCISYCLAFAGLHYGRSGTSVSWTAPSALVSDVKTAAELVVEAVRLAFRRRFRHRYRATAGAGLCLLAAALAVAAALGDGALPYRTPRVADALDRGAAPASPSAPLVSLSVAPRLALPGLDIAGAKLAFGPRLETGEAAPALPAPGEGPAVVAPAVASLPVAAESLAQPAVVMVRPHRPAGPPQLAVVIDDLGLDMRAARQAVDLPSPVTLSFLPYGYELDRLTAAAAARGHDVFLHMPLEPMGSADPGPNALLTSLSPAEVARRIAWDFARLPGAVGVNNHMGSRGTADPALMLAVLAEVKRRRLVFVDSLTTPLSVVPAIAGRLGVPLATRDVFLDNEPTTDAVQARLAEAERLARRHGSAIAIGHPFPATLALLADWLPDAERRGVRLVTARSLTRQEPCGAVTVAVGGAAPAC